MISKYFNIHCYIMQCQIFVAIILFYFNAKHQKQTLEMLDKFSTTEFAHKQKNMQPIWTLIKLYNIFYSSYVHLYFIPTRKMEMPHKHNSTVFIWTLCMPRPPILFLVYLWVKKDWEEKKSSFSFFPNHHFQGMQLVNTGEYYK